MALVWIVEKPCKDQAGLAELLIGSYAVRLIASVPSLHTLLKMRGTRRPDVLMVDARALGSGGIEQLAGVVTELSPKSQLILLAEDFPNVPQSDRRGSAIWTTIPRILDPFELAAVIEASIHEASASGGVKAEDSYQWADVVLNWTSFCLTVGHGLEQVILTPTEARLLRILLKEPGRCRTREEIVMLVWEGVTVGSRTLDSHVSRLRRRLDKSSLTIESVYGAGYMLTEK